jgi:hypothetical protein
MSPALAAAISWLIHTAVGGGILLLVGRVLVGRVRPVGLRQRLAEAFVLAALLLSVLSLAPAWIHLPLPSSHPTPTHVEAADPVRPEIPAEPAPVPEVEPAPPEVAFLPAEPPPEAPAARPTPEKSEADVVPPADAGLPAGLFPAVVLALYVCGAGFFVGRWMLGHLALGRLLRRTGPPPERAARLFREMAGPRKARLLVSDRVRAPFSAGLWRPTVVLPAAVADGAPERELRWIFAHELTHLRRRDAWSALLFGLAQAVYFFVPWFWRLRREARLCQEYVADAHAAESAPADYAQFLLRWARSGRLPAGAAGVSGGSSDLFRRIAMLLHQSSPVEGRCPRRWVLSMVGGVLALAVLGAGIGLRAAPLPEKDKPKEEPKQEKEKAKKPAEVFPGFPNFPEFPKEGAPGLKEQHRRYMEEMQKAMERARKIMGRRGMAGGLPQGFPAFPGAFGQAGESHGRLGVVVQTPDETLVDQLELPKGQGLVIRRVANDSAAQKAGLKAHDILLEVDGKAVSSDPAEFVRMLGDIKADTAVDVVVLRKGRKETVKGLKLPEAKKAPEAGARLPALPAFPDVPNLPNLPNFPALPGAGGFGRGLGGAGTSTSISRSGDEFTASRSEGDLSIKVTGKVVGEKKAAVKEIEVRDGKESNTYKEVGKVPARYRDKVEKLIEQAAGGTPGAVVPEKKPADF